MGSEMCIRDRFLTAGQGGQALGGELRAAPVDVEAATAWRMGRLVVRDRPLRDACRCGLSPAIKRTPLARRLRFFGLSLDAGVVGAPC